MPREERDAMKATRVVLEDHGVLCDSEPLAVAFLFYRPNHHKVDGDNLVKFALDVAQGILWRNDNQVLAHAAVIRVDKRSPRTAIGWARL